MLSVRPWRDSAAISISLLAVMFHRNIDIAELVSTSRLKMVIFLIVNFSGTKYPSSENGEMGHFSDHGFACTARSSE